jgi:hypothetical protein
MGVGTRTTQLHCFIIWWFAQGLDHLKTHTDLGAKSASRPGYNYNLQSRSQSSSQSGIHKLNLVGNKSLRGNCSVIIQGDEEDRSSVFAHIARTVRWRLNTIKLKVNWWRKLWLTKLGVQTFKWGLPRGSIPEFGVQWVELQLFTSWDLGYSLPGRTINQGRGYIDDVWGFGASFYKYLYGHPINSGSNYA